MPRKPWNTPTLVAALVNNRAHPFVKDHLHDLTEAHGKLVAILRKDPQLLPKDPVAMARAVEELARILFAAFAVGHHMDLLPDQLLAAMMDTYNFTNLEDRRSGVDRRRP